MMFRTELNREQTDPRSERQMLRFSSFLVLLVISASSALADRYDVYLYHDSNNALPWNFEVAVGRPQPTPGPVANQIGWRQLTAPRGPNQLTLDPGDTFRDCLDCPEMIVVPAGSFMMGMSANEKEEDEADDYGPQRKVTIAQPFAVGRYEVTFQEWDACAADGGCEPQTQDQGWGRGRRPVFKVRWKDAKAYVAWLSKKTGMQYRLLSEAEWEYAARAGTRTRFPWGNTITNAQANYTGTFTYSYDGKVKFSGFRGAKKIQTLEVGSFSPNAFGLYDMHGNASEWVEDCYRYTYAEFPQTPLDGSPRVWACNQHVVRGGSFKHGFPGPLRSASRTSESEGELDNEYGYVGLRVARTLTLHVARTPKSPSSTTVR